MVECWLEASTEQSESNPGRSLGTITMKRRAVWKTVPPHKRSIRVNPRKICVRKKLGGDATNTDSTVFIRDGVQSEKEFQHTLFVTP